MHSYFLVLLFSDIYIEEKQMSDYHDYDDDSEYDDFSVEDIYAGAYGGYDDLYDDVVEEAGYDAWDIVNPEFNFDEERPLFEFDPFSEYYDLSKDESGSVVMTYQALGELSEMTARLLQAWEKRSTSAVHSESPDVSEVSDHISIHIIIFSSENIKHIFIFEYENQ